MIRSNSLLITVFCASLIWSLPSLGSEAEINIGSQRELFVDHYLIDRLDESYLLLHEPRPAEVVMRFDRSWEGIYCGYVTVIKDRDQYLMYYRGLPTAQHGPATEVTCYAESSDGINWIRPNLGLYEVQAAMWMPCPVIAYGLSLS